MVFCDFVVCTYLIFGESSLQLIDVTNSRPEMIFNQMGSISAKVGVVKQTCATSLIPKLSPPSPPKKKILYETLLMELIFLITFIQLQDIVTIILAVEMGNHGRTFGTQESLINREVKEIKYLLER